MYTVIQQLEITIEQVRSGHNQLRNKMAIGSIFKNKYMYAESYSLGGFECW